MPQQIRTTFSLHYTGGTLDRATEKRGDTDWIAERLTHSSSLIAPVWRNRNLIHHHDEPTAVLTVGNDAQKFLELAEDIVLLGIEQENGNTIFAADLSHHDDEAIAPLTNGASFLDLREIGPMMSREEANLLAFARGVMFWHRRQKYCGICGHPTESRNAGHMRQCTNPECGREHYPRTDPAVIMLVTRDTPNGEVCLLAHKAAMPEGRFSVRARAISEEITCDDVEIAEAYWFSRDDLKHFPEKGYQLSRPDSIARCLIDEWLNEGD
jgi:NAD+ diphosphatase